MPTDVLFFHSKKINVEKKDFNDSEINVTFFKYDDLNKLKDEFKDALLTKINCCNHIVVFIDNKNIYLELIKSYGHYFCFFYFDRKNIIEKISQKDFINDKLKIFNWLKNVILNRCNNGFISLPKRNFNHKKVIELFNKLKQISDFSHEKDDFNNFEKQLKLIMQKVRRPRRLRNSYLDKTIFFVDDNELIFAYSDHVHGSAGTGKKDGHDIFCALSAKFFFGCYLDIKRHYDVYKQTTKNKTEISGKFLRCHDIPNDKITDIRKTDHINMFCNDFIG